MYTVSSIPVKHKVEYQVNSVLFGSSFGFYKCTRVQ